MACKFFALPRNKIKFKVMENLKEILPATPKICNAEAALYQALVMPHPFLQENNGG